MRITMFPLMALFVITLAVVSGCRQKVSPPTSLSSPPAKPPTTSTHRAEAALPAAAAERSPCQLKLLTEPAAIRRGDPAGLLVGSPRVKVDGCPHNPIQAKLFVDVPNHEAILKKEADKIRIFPVSELADSAFRVRTIRVKLEAECVYHQTHAEADWEIRVYPRNAVIEPPAESAGVPPNAMTPRLGDQTAEPRPQQPLHTNPWLPSAQADPSARRSLHAIKIESPLPDALVKGGQLLLVRGRATLPPGTTRVRLRLLEDRGQPLTQPTCQVAEDGSFVGSLMVPKTVPPTVYLEARAGSVVSGRVRLRGQ